jgi:hypothetical protein
MSMLKEACMRGKLSELNRAKQVKYRHLDNMQESLNKNIQQNIFPHWRNH